NNKYPTRLYSSLLSDEGEPRFHPSDEEIVTLNYHTNATTDLVYPSLTENQKLKFLGILCKEIVTAQPPSPLAQDYHNSCTIANLLGIIGLGGLFGIKLTGDKTGTVKPTQVGSKYYIYENFTIDCGWGY